MKLNKVTIMIVFVGINVILAELKIVLTGNLIFEAVKPPLVLMEVLFFISNTGFN